MRSLLQQTDSSSGPVFDCYIPEVEACRPAAIQVGSLMNVERWIGCPDGDHTDTRRPDHGREECPRYPTRSCDGRRSARSVMQCPLAVPSRYV